MEPAFVDVWSVMKGCERCGRGYSRRWYETPEGHCCILCYRVLCGRRETCDQCGHRPTRLHYTPYAYAQRWCRGCLRRHRLRLRHREWLHNRCSRCECWAPGCLTPSKMIETDLWCPTCHARYDFFYNMSAEEFARHP